MSTELPDVNVLLALHLVEHQHHQVALHWWNSAIKVLTTPVSESGFVRMLLNVHVMDGKPLTGAEALATLEDLRAQPKTTFHPDATSLANPRIRVSQLTGSGQVTDLHLLNVAVDAGAVFVTLDSKITAPLTARERKHVRILR